MYREIKRCRICGNEDLVPIINLGKQYLTGIFPESKKRALSSGHLELVKCQEDKEDNFCGLLQLKQSYDFDELYGMDYGYRSGLNQSMVNHLHEKVRGILKRTSLVPGDIVLDIGSNDSTLLQAYPKDGLALVGMDPTGKKFKQYYPNYIQLIPDFFSAETFRKNFPNKKAKVITSMAMFYDLESPLDFMKQVYEILSDNGLWVFEQSYMPSMLEANAYDTICHEHLEYYRLKQIKWLTDRAGFKIVDIELNAANGGSFLVIVAKLKSSYRQNSKLIEKLLNQELAKGLNTLRPYKRFKQRVYKHRDELRAAIQKIKASNKKIIGYGASTKGNVVLQFCGLTIRDIPYIAEINQNKFGCYTPGTYIPIISEEEARAMKPDYFLALPWHFKESIISREKHYLAGGGHFLFPLPAIEVI